MSFIMRKLDRYIGKNFLIGYLIALCVLIGMRIIIDLFVKLDEFTESTTKVGIFGVMKNILSFYGLNSLLYFRDFAGMITVVAAAFSFGKMVRANELVAVMASGVSLKRTIGPVLFLAFILTGVVVIDQEIVIPPLAGKLTRSHDAIPGQESYDVRFISDEKGSLIFSQKFDVKTSTLYYPTILLRRLSSKDDVWEVTGRIDADQAVYNRQAGRWDLRRKDTNHPGQWIASGLLTEKDPAKPVKTIEFYSSDVTTETIPIRTASEYLSLLSLRQLTTLAGQNTKIKDLAELYSQKHFRITEPIINMLMLFLSLPVLVCRDPKSMKSAVLISFLVTTACFIVTFLCKMLATEQFVFDRIIPEFWAWLPVFIFAPTSWIMLDSMKT
jgi:lipopolysaccharide export system permease protein